MDKKWTVRDTFFAIIGLAQVALLVVLLMAMVQADRQYEQVRHLIDLLETNLQPGRGPMGLGEPASRPIVPDSAAATQSGTGPGPATQAAAVDEGDWLIRYMTEPQNLNPVTSTDAYESAVNSYVFESLLDRDNQTLKFVPLLAKRWEIGEDKLRFRFYLDERARWADGRPVTADDVLFSFQTIMDPGVNCPHLKVYYQDVQECRRLDAHTVEFTYRKPYWRALEICGGMTILPRHFYAYDDPKAFNLKTLQTLGSGPYRLVEWTRGKHILLERNYNYWRPERRPALKRIVFQMLGTDQAAFQALRAGQLDMMSLSPEQWALQTADPDFQKRFRKLKWLSDGFSYIGWNQRRPFFQDPRVRLAMTLLTPRELICEKVYYGLAQIATGPFNSKTAAHDSSIAPHPYDPRRAVALLDQAGWIDHDGDGVRDRDGVAFRFELKIPAGRDTSRQIVTLLKQELEKVGIETTLTVLEWAVFLDQINKREFDAVILGWSMGLEPDPYQIWHSSQIAGEGHNFIGYVNAEIDRICVESRTCFDEAQRTRMFHRFHRIIHEEQPYTFLVVPESLLAVDRRFHHVTVYPMGVDTKEWYVPRALQRY